MVKLLTFRIESWCGMKGSDYLSYCGPVCSKLHGNHFITWFRCNMMLNERPGLSGVQWMYLLQNKCKTLNSISPVKALRKLNYSNILKTLNSISPVKALQKHPYSNILKISPQKKNWKFSDKNSDIFHISARNIECGYWLERPHRDRSNEYPQSMFLSRNKKYNVYPCKPQFYYIKVWFFRGSKLGVFSWWEVLYLPNILRYLKSLPYKS